MYPFGSEAMSRLLLLGLGAGVAALASSWLVTARLRICGVRCSAWRYALLRWRLRSKDDLIVSCLAQWYEEPWLTLARHARW